jgi:hypothetical protein
VQAVNKLAKEGKFIGSSGTIDRDIPKATALMEQAITASVKNIFGCLVFDGASTKHCGSKKPVLVLFNSSQLPEGVVHLNTLIPDEDGVFDMDKMGEELAATCKKYGIKMSHVTVSVAQIFIIR